MKALWITIVSLLFIKQIMAHNGAEFDQRLGAECIDTLHETRIVSSTGELAKNGVYPLFVKAKEVANDKGKFGGVVRNNRINARGGVDLHIDHGQAVRAIHDATVTSSGYWYMGSFSITTQLDNGMIVRYGFLHPSIAVKKGDVIKAGQLIGVVAKSKYHPEASRLRIEYFSGESAGPLSVNKACINRRSDVMNPDHIIKKLEAELK